ncbi:MAG: hypothetical protein L6263_02680 [Desulfobacteraceae bacterium]|nr:hypothetical protein [Desulfobacteraceae bacterium]
MPKLIYNPITRTIINELKTILGARYIIHDDPEKLEPYSHDEITEKAYAHMPDVVVKPRTAGEIAQIIKVANREKIPVTPRCAENSF